MSPSAAEEHQIGALLEPTPRRGTCEGWQNWRGSRASFTPAPKLTLDQWRALSPRQRSLHDLHRTVTHVRLPLQETPMALKVTRLLNRRLRNNALKTRPSTRAGVMVSGWGHQGKTETVCEVAAAFEDAWLVLHDHLNPNTVEGTRDLHAPVVHVQTPVTAKPKGACQAILNFFGAVNRRLTLPQLIRQVAGSLDDHGTQRSSSMTPGFACTAPTSRTPST